MKGAVHGWPENVRAYFDVAERFAPDVVISDFESWSYLFAKHRGLPVILAKLDLVLAAAVSGNAPAATDD